MNGKLWTGRIDGEDRLHHRIFQRVSFDREVSPNDFVLHGFAVDEGVRRNKGRVGAKDAPDIIRKNMANFPVIHPDFGLKDFGNIYCEGHQLEKAQSDLADSVTKILVEGGKSVVLGGGHEVTYAHYSGIKKAFPEKKILIINLDAHFDNREPEAGIGATSGTGFWQIAHEGEIHSLHIGIQRNSNTLQLFETARTFEMNYILAEDLFYENLKNIYPKIDALFTECDVAYLTVCMDVFNVSLAPGVSAAAYNGIFANDTFTHFFRHILKNEKLVAMDVAEVNPRYDIGDRTARLAASLVNDWFMYHNRDFAGQI